MKDEGWYREYTISLSPTLSSSSSSSSSRCYLALGELWVQIRSGICSCRYELYLNCPPLVKCENSEYLCGAAGIYCFMKVQACRAVGSLGHIYCTFFTSILFTIVPYNSGVLAVVGNFVVTSLLVVTAVAFLNAREFIFLLKNQVTNTYAIFLYADCYLTWKLFFGKRPKPFHWFPSLFCLPFLTLN